MLLNSLNFLLFMTVDFLVSQKHALQEIRKSVTKYDKIKYIIKKNYIKPNVDMSVQN